MYYLIVVHAGTKKSRSDGLDYIGEVEMEMLGRSLVRHLSWLPRSRSIAIIRSDFPSHKVSGEKLKEVVGGRLFSAGRSRKDYFTRAGLPRTV